MFLAAASPDSLADITESAIAVKLALDGEFDKRIAELKKVRDEIRAHELTVKTLAEAQKLKAQAEKDAATMLSDAESVHAAVEASQKEAERRAKELSALEATLKARIAENDLASAELSRKQTTFANKETALNASFEERDRNLSIAEERVRVDSAALEQRKRRVEETLKTA